MSEGVWENRGRARGAKMFTCNWKWPPTSSFAFTLRRKRHCVLLRCTVQPRCNSEELLRGRFHSMKAHSDFLSGASMVFSHKLHFWHSPNQNQWEWQLLFSFYSPTCWQRSEFASSPLFKLWIFCSKIILTASWILGACHPVGLQDPLPSKSAQYLIILFLWFQIMFE